MNNELSKGFTGVEINGVRFSNIGEMLHYMDRQRKQLSKAKEIIKTFLAIANNDVEYVQNSKDCKDFWKELCEKAEQFISEVEK